LEKILPAAGLTNIVAKESYSSKSVDLSSLVIKMKAMKPDIFMVTSYTADAMLLVRQAKEMGFNVKVWQGMGAGYGQPAFAQALGRDSEYILDVNVPSTFINRKVVPGLDEFMRRYQKKYGEPYEGILSQLSYTGAIAVLDIIKRAGSLDVDAIAKAAWGTDIPSWSTPVGWGVKFNGPGQPHPGQNARALPYISQWKNKQQQVIWPMKARYTDPVLPMPTWKERGN
jgi:branched-chain amino acid transport system substrate-binding protein